MVSTENKNHIGKVVHNYLPKAVTTFVLAAHFSELQRSIEHVTFTNALVTAAVFAAWVSVSGPAAGHDI
jgi:hypothetical protein